MQRCPPSRRARNTEPGAIRNRELKEEEGLRKAREISHACYLINNDMHRISGRLEMRQYAARHYH